MKNFRSKRFLYGALIILAAGNIFIWRAIIFGGGAENPELYFLDVGQGDSQLINLPGDVQILIDGGKGPKVLNELSEILPPQDRYIDLVISTHPDFDHYGGLIDVLKTYEVGAVITNGLSSKAAAYQDFIRVIQESKIPELHLREGDRIRYQDAIFDVLAPASEDLSKKDDNDASLVLMLKKSGLRALYTGDITAKKELNLAKKYNLSAQILKVSHHGSKYSSSSEFLKAVQPKLAIIEVGEKNQYGHPASEVLAKLTEVGSKILRTDKDQTIKIVLAENKLKILKK
jgi:competence protein ComEC